MAAAGKVGPVRVQGRDLELFANVEGRWHLVFEGQTVGYGNTVDAAKASARTYFKKQEVKVEVPFQREGFEGYGENRKRIVEAGVADAVRADDYRKVLVTINGERDQIERSRDVWRAETPEEEIARYRELEAERNPALQQDERQIEKAWQFHLAEAVRDAIEEKAAQSCNEYAQEVADLDENRAARGQERTAEPVAQAHARHRWRLQCGQHPADGDLMKPASSRARDEGGRGDHRGQEHRPR